MNKIYQSFIRYSLVGFSGGLTTYLVDRGIEVDLANRFAESLIELIMLGMSIAPVVLTGFWSVKKNKKEISEVETLRKQLEEERRKNEK